MPAAAAASSAAAAVGRSVTFARIPGIPIAAAPEPADVDGGDAALNVASANSSSIYLFDFSFLRHVRHGDAALKKHQGVTPLREWNESI